MTQKIIPHLWFDTQAEEAANFYVSLFKNSKVKNVVRYSEASAQASGMRVGTVMVAEFELAGQKFAGLNGGPLFKFTPAISFFVNCETTEETEHLFQVLSERGEILMPLDKYPFSAKYAWINDRYGVSWQLHTGSYRQKISCCLMFVQQQHGKAKEAMEFYVSVFNKSKIDNVVPYDKSEGEKKGAIKHGSFFLEDEQFIAMDSGLNHSFSFTPAVSLMVDCQDQKEIDHYWNRLSSVPTAEQCGWLQDKYGVSWQIVPTVLREMIQDKNLKKSENVVRAMLQMKKLDIAMLKQAYQQQ